MQSGVDFTRVTTYASMDYDVIQNTVALAKFRTIEDKKLPQNITAFRPLLATAVSEMCVVDKTFNKDSGLPEVKEIPLDKIYSHPSNNLLKEITQLSTDWYYKEYTDRFKVENPLDKNVIEGLKELRKCCFNVHSQDVDKFVLYLLKAVKYIQDFGKTGVNDSSYQKALFITSNVMRNGKSSIIQRVREGAERAGYMTERDLRAPLGSFENPKSTSDVHLATVEEMRYDKQISVGTVMHWLRHEMFDYSEKYVMKTSLPSRAFILAAGNGEPWAKGDPCWDIVHTISMRIEDLLNEGGEVADIVRQGQDVHLEKLFQASNIDKAIKALEEIVNSKEDVNIPKSDLTEVRSVPFVAQLIDVIQTMKDCTIDWSGVSISKLKRIWREIGKPEWDALKIQQLGRVCNNLYSKRIIKKCSKDTQDEYKKWDLTSLLDYTIDDLSDNVRVDETALDEFWATQKAWDSLFEKLENGINVRSLVEVISDDLKELLVDVTAPSKALEVLENKDNEVTLMSILDKGLQDDRFEGIIWPPDLINHIRRIFINEYFLE